MRRDQVLTIRLAPEEMALLSALRHAIYEDASQADVLVWALEELDHRVVAGDDIGTVIREDGPALCAVAQRQLERARGKTHWSEGHRGRPPRLTASDRQLISALQKEGATKV
jgi:hypothetical protein